MKYRTIFFAQGDDSLEFEHVYEHDGAQGLLELISRYDLYNLDANAIDVQPWGPYDVLEHVMEGTLHLVITVNARLGYIGVTQVVYGE